MSSTYRSLADHARDLWGPSVVGGKLGVSETLFHGCTPGKVAEIKREGLYPALPHGIAGPSGLRFPEMSGIYLSNILQVARQVVRMRQGHEPIYDAQTLYDSYRPSEPEDEFVIVVSVYGVRMSYSSYFVCESPLGPERIRGTYAELQRAGKVYVNSRGLML